MSEIRTNYSNKFKKQNSPMNTTSCRVKTRSDGVPESNGLELLDHRIKPDNDNSFEKIVQKTN